MDCVPFSWIRRLHNVKVTFFPQIDLGIITIPIEKNLNNFVCGHVTW